MLLVDPIGALARVGLEGLYGVPRLLHRTGHEPADRMSLPAHLLHDLRQRGAVLPLEHRDHLASLAALARPGRLRRPVDQTNDLGLPQISRKHWAQSVRSLNPRPLKIIGTHFSTRAARVFACFAPET